MSFISILWIVICAGAKDWSRDIAGYQIKDCNELLEEIMNVLFVGLPAFRSMLNMEKDRIEHMEEVKARPKAQDQEDQREGDDLLLR